MITFIFYAKRLKQYYLIPSTARQKRAAMIAQLIYHEIKKL